MKLELQSLTMGFGKTIETKFNKVPLKRDRFIKGKWQDSSSCFKMFCTVKDKLEVQKTASFSFSIN